MGERHVPWLERYCEKALAEKVVFEACAFIAVTTTNLSEARRFWVTLLDLPGCVAVADTKKEVLKLIQEAIEFYIEGLREDGQPIPQPSSSVEYVEVRAA